MATENTILFSPIASTMAACVSEREAKFGISFSRVPSLPLLGGNDEPITLSYQITLFGPKGADVRHLVLK